MMSGRSLSDNGAAAIKNLIATSVRGMNFTNVAVFDADTMMEVGGRSDAGDYGSAKDVTALTSLVENNIAANVRRVLEKLYGQGKTAVSVKGTLNMEKLIQENTRYTTPEKIDEQDKTGLLYKEDTANENSGAAVPGSGGVVRTRTRRDIPIRMARRPLPTYMQTAVLPGNGCMIPLRSSARWTRGYWRTLPLVS